MNHDYINKSNLIDQYLLGRLSEEEAERFEEHFIDCSECIEQLNVTRSFIDDLKGLAVQETLLSGYKPVAATHWWNILNLVPARAWALAVLSFVALSGIFAIYSVRKVNRLNAELQQAKVEIAQARREPQEFSTSGFTANNNLTAKVESGQTNDTHDQFARPEASKKKVTSHRPDTSETNFKIYALIAAVRGDVPKSNEIAPPPTSKSFAFSIQIEDSDFDRYRVSIVNSVGRNVWRQANFRRDQYGNLSLRLKSNFLSPGTYELRVEGQSAPNQWSTVGNFPFRFR